ncbi:hypothetical protein B0T21DRAFT_291846, partial [Apiosordaria backusii]
MDIVIFASPTAAITMMVCILSSLSLFFPRLRRGCVVAAVCGMLGGSVAHFHGAAGFSLGMYAAATFAFVMALVFSPLLGLVNVLVKHAVAFVCCLAAERARLWALLAGELQASLEMFVDFVLKYSRGHTLLRGLLEEEARCHDQELRFAEQCFTIGLSEQNLSASVDDFRRAHPSRSLPGCVRTFFAEQIPLAEKEDGPVERSLSTAWKRLLCLAGFYTVLFDTELARLKTFRVKRDEVIKKRQDHIDSSIEIQRIIVKEMKAHPIVKPKAVSRLPARVLAPKPDSFVPTVFSSPRRIERKDLSVAEILLSRPLTPRSRTKVLPVTE